MQPHADLARHGVARFVAVDDADYDPIRRTGLQADGVRMQR